MSEIKKIENSKIELTCKIGGQVWQDAQTTSFKKLKAKLDIKGFRKGQIPDAIAKKHISDEHVMFEALYVVAQQMLEEAIKEHDVKLIDRPTIVNQNLTKEECIVVFGCSVEPDVKLGDYKSIKYHLEEVKVEDKDVESELEIELNRKADLELKEDATVEKGDFATIDFEGYLNDEKFEGGTSTNYELEIGSNSFIPGFEDQLIGMKSEEEKDINVTFPQDYHAENLKGKPVVFKVKVHEIKTKVKPELNDEFVKGLKIEKVETVDDYKTYLKEKLEKRKANQIQQKADEEVLNKLVEITEVDLPEVMIKQESKRMLDGFKANIEQQGMKYEQYLKVFNQSEDNILETYKESAIKNLKVSLALAQVAKLENIDACEAEIEDKYEELAKLYSLEVDKIKSFIPVENIKDDLVHQKSFDFFKNNK